MSTTDDRLKKIEGQLQALWDKYDAIQKERQEERINKAVWRSKVDDFMNSLDITKFVVWQNHINEFVDFTADLNLGDWKPRADTKLTWLYVIGISALGSAIGAFITMLVKGLSGG